MEEAGFRFLDGNYYAEEMGLEIALTWEKVSGVSGYQVYRKEEGGSDRRVKTVSWKESSWTDTKVNP